MNCGSRPPRARVTLFRSSWLENLTMVSLRWFVVLWALLLPAIGAAGFAFASTLWAPALIALGWLTWSLTEYLLHRFAFHFEPRSTLLRRAVFIIHGNHHADPNDPLRNLMPPIVSMPVGLLVWATAIALAGAAGTWLLFGFTFGYVTYDLVHYACHQFAFKGRLGRILKAHHMRHHHLNIKGNYAITSVFWDRVFATRIPLARKA